MKKVRKIEVLEKQTDSEKLKVAAYCRVSTKYESQKSSIDLQVEYYTKYIEDQVDWEFQEFLWIMAADVELRAERIFKQ